MNKENESNIPKKRIRVESDSDSQVISQNDDSDYWPDSENETGMFFIDFNQTFNSNIYLCNLTLYPKNRCNI